MEIAGLIIAALVMGFAYWLYKMGLDILDVDEHFMTAVWAFFALLVGGAIAMYFVLPTPGKNASVGGLVQAWMHPAQAEGENLPLYH